MHDCHQLIELATTLASPDQLAMCAFEVNKQFGLPIVDISYCPDKVVGGSEYVETYEMYIDNMQKTYRSFEETAWNAAMNWPIFNAVESKVGVADDVIDQSGRAKPTIVYLAEFNRERGERDAAATRAGRPANA